MEIYRDCRSLSDSPFNDLKGDHVYKVTEELKVQVLGGTMVFSDEDGYVAFVISEHDFNNFMEKYVSDRVEQAFDDYQR